MKIADPKSLQEWYILKWDNKYGPFSYLEVIQMLQNKSVFEFDFIWKNGNVPIALQEWEFLGDASDVPK